MVLVEEFVCIKCLYICTIEKEKKEMEFTIQVVNYFFEYFLW